MRIFRNLNINWKIIAGFIITLIFTIIVGGMAIWRLGEVNKTVYILTNSLANERQLANDIDSQIWTVRFYANKYISGQSALNMGQYNDEIKRLNDLIQQGQVQITNPERAFIFQKIQQDVKNYETTFTEIQKTIEDRENLRTTMLDQQGQVGEAKLLQLQQEAYSSENLSMIEAAGNLYTAFTRMRLETTQYLLSGDDQSAQNFKASYEQAHTIIKRMNGLVDETTKSTFMLTQAAIEGYNSSFQRLQKEFNNQKTLQGSLNLLGPNICNNAVNISTNVQAEYAALSSQTDRTVNQTYPIIIGSMLAAMLFSILLGIFIARQITRPLRQVMQTSEQIATIDLKNLVNEMKGMAEGDLTRRMTISAQPLNIRSKDETGKMSEAFNVMIFQLQEVGEEFETMAKKLNEAVRQVADNANTLGASSVQVSQSAEQTGEAITGIAATIQQVAQGIARQSSSVSRTVNSVEQLTQAIDGVAKGAQEQAGAVNRASELATQINTAIQQVAESGEAVTRDSANAAQAARNGVQTVQETINRMGSIKSKVSISSQKVQEMGQRSTDISLIVETIQEIASQTNLLALNAAIEAARAGEYGKGFAVVADEVRKLAERSAAATKEINNLVKTIQGTVKEAVEAMGEGDMEIEDGVAQADQAGKVLETILNAVEAVHNEADVTTQAAQKMFAYSSQLSDAMDTVSAVVEENTAATEQMAASSSEVFVAIEDIASISEENSAATEEVSAATEEISSQVEEGTASAASLSEMAEELQRVVASFKLDKTTKETPLSPAKTERDNVEVNLPTPAAE